MFSKLRKKLLLLVLMVTSLVLIASFAVVYTITYRNIQSQNLKKLNDSSLTTLLPGLPDEFLGILQPLMLPSDYRPSFTLLLDTNGALLYKQSLIDMAEEDYEKAAQRAWQHPSSKAAIRIGGRLWQYAVSHEGVFTLSTGQSVQTSQGVAVAFLDVTESHQTLRDLLVTFVVVGIFTLAGVLMISMVFASRAVRPIKVAWEAQKQFVADASHELKTPLTIIHSNYGALVSRKTETIESQMKWLNNIKDGADRMNHLVGSLLYLARAEAVDTGGDVAPFNCSELVQAEIRALETAAAGRDLCISQAVDPDIILPRDREKVAQVVRILLDNAIRYANEGGDISVTLKRERHHVIFTIKNTGDGIAADDLEKIFDRFYRADASRTHDGGYGLGLSIAKVVVEGMGGKIQASSEVGKSATFTVVF